MTINELTRTVRLSWGELRAQWAMGRVKRGGFRALRGLWWRSSARDPQFFRVLVRPDWPNPIPAGATLTTYAEGLRLERDILAMAAELGQRPDEEKLAAAITEVMIRGLAATNLSIEDVGLAPSVPADLERARVKLAAIQVLELLNRDMGSRLKPVIERIEALNAWAVGIDAADKAADSLGVSLEDGPGLTVRQWFRKQRAELWRTNENLASRLDTAIPFILRRDLGHLIDARRWFTSWPTASDPLVDTLIPPRWLEAEALECFKPRPRPWEIETLTWSPAAGSFLSNAYRDVADGLTDEIAAFAGVPRRFIFEKRAEPLKPAPLCARCDQPVIDLAEGCPCWGRCSDRRYGEQCARTAGHEGDHRGLRHCWINGPKRCSVVEAGVRCNLEADHDGDHVNDRHRWPAEPMRRCGSRDSGQRCALQDGHGGLHQDTIGHRPRYWNRR